MTNVFTNETNDKDFQNSLINYLINYLIENKNRNRKPITLFLNPSLFDEFSEVCKKLGLIHGKSKGNVAIEGFMSFMVEKFRDAPKVVQTTLYYKPEINVQQNVTVNIAQKLELKLVKKSLGNVLDALENGKGDSKFYRDRLLDALSKAISVYNKTRDGDVAKLLERAEKWV